MGFFCPQCSLAADFLPTFMYCMGSCNFEVVQTALRNLPEYVLLCQGEGRTRKAHLRRLFFIAPRAARYHGLLSSPRRTRRHPAAQGLHRGHLRPDQHQLRHRRVHESPPHGSHIASTRLLSSSLHSGASCFSFFFPPILLNSETHRTLPAPSRCG